MEYFEFDPLRNNYQTETQLMPPQRSQIIKLASLSQNATESILNCAPDKFKYEFKSI